MTDERAPAPQQLAEADPADDEPPEHHGQRHDGEPHPPRARLHTAEKINSNYQLSPSSASASNGCSEC